MASKLRNPLYPRLPESLTLSSDDEDFLSTENGREARGTLPDSAPQPRPRSNHETLGNHPNNGGSGRDSQRSFEASGTLSLADFESKYLNHSGLHSPKKSHRSHSKAVGDSSLLKGLLVSVWTWALRGYRYFQSAKKWEIVLVGSVLGVALAAVLSGTKDNRLACPPSKDHEPCIDAFQLKPALALARTIRDFLHIRAGQYACGDGSVTTPNMSVEQLETLFPKFTPSQHKAVLLLMLHNPHWGVRWVCTLTNKVIIDWTHTPAHSDVLFSVMPSVSVRCRIYLIISGLWAWVKLVPVVLLAIVTAVGLVQWYLQRRELHKRAVFSMVERIIDILKHHYDMSRRKKDLLPYLAIIHVRDMLIPPSERDHKQWAWEKACHWIASRESRVRVEVRKVAGEDLEVWRWIQEDPPITAEPSTHSHQRRSFWQGKAFEHYHPSVENKVAPSSGSPSPCVRLKNMFEHTKHMDDEQAGEIENSVLDRCTVFGGVVHTFVDRKSPFGCVYLKMDSVRAATEAYKALHGGWYKGKLVTAKYIPEAKYYKWFPHAATATKHIHPT